jgi:hypothetical protein
MIADRDLREIGGDDARPDGGRWHVSAAYDGLSRPSSGSLSRVIQTLLPTVAVAVILTSLTGLAFARGTAQPDPTRPAPASRSYSELPASTAADPDKTFHVFYLVSSEAERARVSQLLEARFQEALNEASALAPHLPAGQLRTTVMVAADAAEEERALRLIKDLQAAGWGEQALNEVQIVDLRDRAP